MTNFLFQFCLLSAALLLAFTSHLLVTAAPTVEHTVRRGSHSSASSSFVRTKSSNQLISQHPRQATRSSSTTSRTTQLSTSSLDVSYSERQTAATAQRLVADVRYFLKRGAPHGCPNMIFHGKKLQTNDLPQNFVAQIPIDDIKVNGKPCHGDDMDLTSFQFAKRNGYNIANFKMSVQETIELVGLDKGSRKCGTYQASEPMQYIFTTNFRPVYDHLIKDRFQSNSFPEIDQLLDDEDAESNHGRVWMVSIPQIRNGDSYRVCMYRGTIGGTVTTENNEGTGDSNNEGDEGEEGNELDAITPEPTVELSPEPSTPADNEENSTTDDENPKDQPDQNNTTDSTNVGQDNTFGQAFNQSTSTETDKKSDSSSSCFPGDSIIFTSDDSSTELGASKRWSSKRIGDLGVGEYVMTGMEDESLAGSRVFGFTHEVKDKWISFVQIRTDQNHSLEATSGHYIRVWPDGVLRTARNVQIGDSLIAMRLSKESGEAVKTRERVISVGNVVRKGIYNPQTLHGDIIVNGFLVSTYTERIEMEMAHALLTPLRAAYRWFGLAMSISQESKTIGTFRMTRT